MFKLGVEYPREDLLSFVGSKQQQSGIIWGPKHPDCVVLTSCGRHCAEAGYEDKKYADGTWTYFGQGQSGDQDASSYANRLLVSERKMLLLLLHVT